MAEKRLSSKVKKKEVRGCIPSRSRAEEQTGATTDNVVSVTRIPEVPMQIHPRTHCTHARKPPIRNLASISERDGIQLGLYQIDPP